MDDILGTAMWLKKDRSKTYVVDGVNRVKKKVHLSPTHEGGGTLWKSMELLWKDYERARAMVAGDRVGNAPAPRELVEPKSKLKEPDSEDEVMSDEEKARWLGEG